MSVQRVPGASVRFRVEPTKLPGEPWGYVLRLSHRLARLALACLAPVVASCTRPPSPKPPLTTVRQLDERARELSGRRVRARGRTWAGGPCNFNRACPHQLLLSWSPDLDALMIDDPLAYTVALQNEAGEAYTCVGHDCQLLQWGRCYEVVGRFQYRVSRNGRELTLRVESFREIADRMDSCGKPLEK